MTDRPTPRPRLVKVRLSGAPDDVSLVEAALAQTLPAGAPSPPYLNRRDPGTVRVYLEVTPA